jgi:DNA mismatch endonuclease (patch repair protein)
MSGEYSYVKLRETDFVAEATRKSMRGNRSYDTKPELRFRSALWAAGLRGYRKNVRKLPGKPDVVYGRAKLAIFVHGCFWHQCPHCARNRAPKANAAYWSAKFLANAERDARNVAALEALGYRVHVVWECRLKDALKVVEEVAALLGRTPAHLL